MKITSVAHSNIAFAKYWGKQGFGHNLPAVPSLSVTLDGLNTTTTIEPLPAAADGDRFMLDGDEVSGRPLSRVTELLDRLIALGGRDSRPRMRVESRNDFPTAAGLASSASAFAALAVAGDAALETNLDTAALSDLARRVSASAGRSLFGGFVVLPAGETKHAEAGLAAHMIHPSDHWAIDVIVAVTTRAAKKVSSTEGMIRTAETSSLYPAWKDAAFAMFEPIASAVGNKDLTALGPLLERCALTMHATALAADPGVVYFNGATLAAIEAVRNLREGGIPAYFTIDAGPHVKVVAERAHRDAIVSALKSTDGVVDVLVATPGEGARVVDRSS